MKGKQLAGRTIAKRKSSINKAKEESTPKKIKQVEKNESGSLKNEWQHLFRQSDNTNGSGSTGFVKHIGALNAVYDEAMLSKITAYREKYPLLMNESKKSDCSFLKFVAWNVNGLRALLKKEDSIHFHSYIHDEDPHILCFGETKMDATQVSAFKDFLPQYPYKYWSCAADKKGYSGTAVFSKIEPIQVKSNFDIRTDEEEVMSNDNEGRFIALEFEKFWLVHTYVPNAGAELRRLDYRTTKWDVSMLKLLKTLDEAKPVVWCGDLNVAHQEIDIHDPKNNRNKTAGFTDAERENFTKVLESGFVDTFRHFQPETRQYTYFSYRFNARAKNKGWRLDYFVVSRSMISLVKSAFVRAQVTGSDHVPIGLLIENDTSKVEAMKSINC